MSTIHQNTNLTWAEVNKREGYDDAAAVIGELLQMNEFLDEVPWRPATHGTYNKQLQAKSLGVGAFAKANSGVTFMASQSDELTEPVKLYEGDSAVDDRLLKGAVDAYKVRDSEDAMNLEGAVQDWLSNLVYGNEADTPEGFKSLDRRRASIVANRCWDGLGTGSDLTSLFLFEFSPRGLWLAYPQGANAGLVSDDRGRNLVDVPSPGTGQMWAWVRHYEVWAAIVLRDDRALQRYANIETTGTSHIFDPDIFIKMKNQLPQMGQMAVGFANRTLKSQIDIDCYEKTNIAFTLREITGYGPVSAVAGVPVRTLEAIVDTESELT